MKNKTLLEEAVEVINATSKVMCPICGKRDWHNAHERQCMLGKFLKKVEAEKKRKLDCSQCEHGFTNPFDQFFCTKEKTGTRICKEFSPKCK